MFNCSWEAGTCVLLNSVAVLHLYLNCRSQSKCSGLHMSLLYFIPRFPEHTSVLNHSPDLSQSMQQFAIVFVLVSSKLDIVLQKMSQNETELFTNPLSAMHLLVISQCLQMVSLFPFFFYPENEHIQLPSSSDIMPNF